MSAGVRKDTFKYIEGEVTAYYETLEALHQLEYETLYGEPGRTDAPYTATGQVVTLLIEHKRMNRMREVTKAIGKIYGQLMDEHRALVDLYYWHRPGELSWDAVAYQLNVSRATALRWRTAFVRDIARELGESQ